MTDAQRNFLIIVLIAVAAFVAAPVLSGLQILNLIVSILFLVAITFALWQLFNRNRSTIAGMRPVHRFVLLASAVGLYVVLLAGFLLHMASAAPYLFFGLLALFIFGIYWSWTNRWSS